MKILTCFICASTIILTFITAAFSQNTQLTKSNPPTLKLIDPSQEYNKTLEKKDVKSSLSKILPRDVFKVLYSKKVQGSRGFRYAMASKDSYLFLQSACLFGEAEYDALIIIDTKESSTSVCWHDHDSAKTIMFSNKNPPKTINIPACSLDFSNEIVDSYSHNN